MFVITMSSYPGFYLLTIEFNPIIKHILPNNITLSQLLYNTNQTFHILGVQGGSPILVYGSSFPLEVVLYFIVIQPTGQFYFVTTKMDVLVRKYSRYLE